MPPPPVPSFSPTSNPRHPAAQIRSNPQHLNNLKQQNTHLNHLKQQSSISNPLVTGSNLTDMQAYLKSVREQLDSLKQDAAALEQVGNGSLEKAALEGEEYA